MSKSFIYINGSTLAALFARTCRQHGLDDVEIATALIQAWVDKYRVRIPRTSNKGTWSKPNMAEDARGLAEKIMRKMTKQGYIPPRGGTAGKEEKMTKQLQRGYIESLRGENECRLRIAKLEYKLARIADWAKSLDDADGWRGLKRDELKKILEEE